VLQTRPEQGRSPEERKQKPKKKKKETKERKKRKEKKPRERKVQAPGLLKCLVDSLLVDAAVESVLESR
jgi:hypothetical protein